MVGIGTISGPSNKNAIINNNIIMYYYQSSLLVTDIANSIIVMCVSLLKTYAFIY